MALQVTQPFLNFPATTGLPLESGYVYVGQYGLNPETNPTSVYYDFNLTTPAAQPIRTLNGFLSKGRNPANIFTPNQYSITVKDKNGSLVYTNLYAGQIPGYNPYFLATAYGDGSLTSATLNAAISQIGSTSARLLITRGTWEITDSVTFPSNITVETENGVSFSISNQNITFCGFQSDQTKKIFTLNGSGKAVFISLYNKEVFAAWWGAEDGENSVVQINNAIKAIDNATVRLSAGTFYVSRTDNVSGGCIMMRSGVALAGQGIDKTYIKRINNDPETFSRLVTGYQITTFELYDMTVDGNRVNQNQSFEQQSSVYLEQVSDFVRVQRVRMSNTIGDGLQTSISNGRVEVIDCQFYWNRRVSCNMGFLTNGIVWGSRFEKIETNGIKVEHDNLNNITKNISILGNYFTTDLTHIGTGIGAITLAVANSGSTVSTIKNIAISGNTFDHVTTCMLYSVGIQNITFTGNTGNDMQFAVRCNSFSDLGYELGKNFIIADNTFNDIEQEAGESDQYVFATYSMKTAKITNNFATKKSGEIIRRFSDTRGCEYIEVQDNVFDGASDFSAITFFKCKMIECKNNKILNMDTATGDGIAITEDSNELIYARLYDNIIQGTFDTGLVFDNVGTSKIYESGTIFLGTYNAQRSGATATRYVWSMEVGEYSISYGTGAPSGAPLGTRGLYIRLDGGASTTLYVWDGSAWNAK